MNARYAARRDEVLARQKQRYWSSPEVRTKKREYDKARRGQLKAAGIAAFTASKREAHYKARYGIDIATYESLFAAQSGRCKICAKTSSRRLAVDHDHTTKEIRGLLCGRCNRGIGQFGDDRILLQRAATYLEGSL